MAAVLQSGPPRSLVPGEQPPDDLFLQQQHLAEPGKFRPGPASDEDPVQKGLWNRPMGRRGYGL